ncbi:MAG: shikimate dehydrogenase [Wenzhouxiangella sp.]
MIRLAVFGRPVTHSLSPRIHRHFGAQLGIPVDYRAVECSVDELPETLARFRDDGGIGANLTLPLKHAGAAVCTRIDRPARRARAVNTLKLEADGWHGFNTDGGGLMLDLERLGIAIGGRRVLVIGAGGATAGILEPLLAAGPAQVCLLNRTLDRARYLAEKFARFGSVTAAALAEGPDDSAYDVLIQSTSAGHAGEALPIERHWLAGHAQAYDLNYGPAHAAFAKWCRENDLPVHDGFGMLVGQAALAFEIWTGRPVPFERAVADISPQPRAASDF